MERHKIQSLASLEHEMRSVVRGKQLAPTDKLNGNLTKL